MVVVRVELVDDGDSLAVVSDEKVVSRRTRVPVDTLKIERRERDSGAGRRDLDGIAALASENGLVDPIVAAAGEGESIDVVVVAAEEIVRARAAGVCIAAGACRDVGKVIGLGREIGDGTGPGVDLQDPDIHRSSPYARSIRDRVGKR